MAVLMSSEAEAFAIPVRGARMNSRRLCLRFLSVLLSVCSVACASLVAEAEPRGPRLVLPESSYDFGSIPQGQQVVHDFVVRNEGGSDLTIHKIAPSCGCTVSTLSSSIIKPGGAETIHVVFDSTGFLGKKNKVVTIVSNSSDSSEAVIKLTGAVVSGVALSPERLDFGEISPAASLATRTREFSVEATDEDARLQATATSLSKFISVRRVRAEPRRITFSVVLNEGAPKGDLRDRLVVEFDGGGRNAVNVPITASILSDLRITPATVSFGLISGTQPVERRLRFENNSGRPVEIEGVVSSDPAVSASVIDLNSGRNGVIVVTLDPRKVRGDLRANVEFKTSHPSEPVVSLSVYGVQPPR